MAFKKVWRNGNIIPYEDAKAHIMCHSFARGSAIFEIFGVYDLPQGPSVFRMDKHLARMQNSANLLGMRLDQSAEEIAVAVKEIVNANQMRAGMVKVTGYYGSDNLTDLCPEEPLDLAIVNIPLEETPGFIPDHPQTVCISKWRKLHPATVPVVAKVAGHYLNGMLAQRDAKERGYEVGLMLDTHGYMAEGSIQGFCIVKDNTIITAPVGIILPSVSRQSTLDMANVLGIKTQEKLVRREEILDADEAFTVTSSTKVWHVGKLEDKVFKQCPGPVTKQLMDTMDGILAGKDERFMEWFTKMSE